MNDLFLLGLLAIGVFAVLYVLTIIVALALYNKNKKEYEEFRDKVNKERREFEAMTYKRMEEQRKEMNQSRVISHVNKELDKHFKE
ncbi:hypothetical protein WL766_06325 [Staphylococcus pasteuri]|uniref:hypothetical protein n=1 Tax=Staphylococcus pasteuri TaxID=45972 RepID=UPI00086EE32F|nr:hypothetical protein [Staphylococcus pasteuri]ODB81798.1 hypothetical protein A9N02_01280 [Staphylococcus sp. AOAB]MCO0861864.1 hypothetical protein [Staphylococcus pasteuri]MCO5360689.1 hypothetical protein [Staphylococcus pasteuri]MCT1926282.1 hypothetical protein [Staphylococcus pasteuri]QDW85138.1 hypothetical protein DWB95_09515 [Staphylococcus pasteuri]